MSILLNLCYKLCMHKKLNSFFSLFFYGFLAVALLYPFFSFSADLERWKEKNSYQNNLTLSLKTDPSVYASITRSKGLNIKAFNQPSFSFKNLEQTRKKMLSLIEVHNWKAHSRKWKTIKDKGELYINGSYVNYKGKKHYFKEFHIYSSQSVLQVLVSAPSLQKLNSAPVEELFQKVREGHIKLLGE